MLARPAEALPSGRDLVYEPKLDGFRALCRTGPGAALLSRRGADLGPAFPEIVEALASLPPALLDGELVAVGSAGCDFAGLCGRLGARGRPARALGRSAPACLVAFDLLEQGGEDLRPLPLRRRRMRLARLLAGAAGSPAAGLVGLIPQTGSLAEAERWMAGLTGAGCEGVVAKRASGAYRPGRRDGWVKVRRRHPREYVVVGMSPRSDGPVALILAARDERGLRHVGITLPIGGEAGRALRGALAPLAAAAPTARGSLDRGRFASDRVTDWTPLLPLLVAEVLVDGEDFGQLRHRARLVRFRPDLDPGGV